MRLWMNYGKGEEINGLYLITSTLDKKLQNMVSISYNKKIFCDFRYNKKILN